ncbi:GRASP55/65 PDZ-like domain protein [Ceratobasidium sp. AG-Ba]|nr:GRASP55/65 PDZ-like domain protein [Ceratobasidium sp. AG-Ba]QRW15094.1 GRASP55/65 PDZ-like domain protein [Ceratobasidium sp. AG-Ba]
MGATASSPNATSSTLPPRRALHVLRVAPGSPAADTDITPFFDFVVGVRGMEGIADVDAASLERIVEAREGTEIQLVIWSSKLQQTRVVSLTPSRKWTSLLPPPPDAKPSLLGLSMRLCTPEFSLDNVWHILDVHEGSPAESAGLVPYGDYIIGYSGGVLERESDFYELVEAHVDKPLRVYVYSHDFDNLREVVLVPNRMWGGQGLLGCGVGYGLLHRIPHDRSRLAPVDIPVEEEAQLFVPAGEPSTNQGPWYGDRQNERYGYGQPLQQQAHGYGDDPYGYDDGHGHSHGEYDHSHGEHDHSHGEHGHSHDDHGHSHGDHGHSHGDHSHSHAHDDHSHSYSPGTRTPVLASLDSGPRTPVPGQHMHIHTRSLSRSFAQMGLGLAHGPVFSLSHTGRREEDAETVTSSGRTGPNAVGGSITSVDD